MNVPILFPPTSRVAEFVLDVSVPAAWVVVRRSTGYTDAVQRKLLTAAILVPTSWPLDLTDHFLAAISRRETTQQRVDHVLTGLGGIGLHIDDEGPYRVWTEMMPLARAHSISVREAAYLELALRTTLPLATINPALTRAATAAGVPIFTP